MSGKKRKQEKKSEQISSEALRRFQANLQTAIDQYEGKDGPPAGKGRQAWLARLLNGEEELVTPKGVARWFAGETMPHRDKRERLANCLNVRMGWLFFNLGPMRDKPDVEHVVLAVEQAIKSVCHEMDGVTKAKLTVALCELLLHRA